MSDISISVPSTPAVTLSVSADSPSLSLALVGAQGAQGEVEGTAISNLSEALSVSDTDELVIVSSGTTKKISALTLKTYFNS